jgi:hypothetical protein
MASTFPPIEAWRFQKSHVFFNLQMGLSHMVLIGFSGYVVSGIDPEISFLGSRSHDPFEPRKVIGGSVPH